MHTKYIFLLISLVHSIDNNHKTDNNTVVITRQFTLPVTSAVADITQSTNIADREKTEHDLKMNSEMYSDHSHIPRSVDTHRRSPDLEKAYEPENVQPVKRNKIEREKDDEEIEEASAEISSASGSDLAGDETEANSGIIKKDVKSPNTVERLNNRYKIFEDKIEHPEPKCYQKCSTPMSYHECALPRCTFKIRSIRNLCFMLCKNQKKKMRRRLREINRFKLPL